MWVKVKLIELWGWIGALGMWMEEILLLYIK